MPMLRRDLSDSTLASVDQPSHLFSRLPSSEHQPITTSANIQGTVVEEGKRRIELDGKDYLLETALRADFALVQSVHADYLGNLS